MLSHIWKKDQTDPLDEQIDAILSEMDNAGVDSEEYPKLMAYLERLYKVKSEKARNPISWDTVALVGGNLLGILIIVAYEQKHAMTSKGFTQIIRPNVPK